MIKDKCEALGSGKADKEAEEGVMGTHDSTLMSRWEDCYGVGEIIDMLMEVVQGMREVRMQI